MSETSFPWGLSPSQPQITTSDKVHLSDDQKKKKKDQEQKKIPLSPLPTSLPNPDLLTNLRGLVIT